MKSKAWRVRFTFLRKWDRQAAALNFAYELPFLALCLSLFPDGSFSRWFCRSIPTGDAEGPFDLMELAGLLRSGSITGETATRAEGDNNWVAFRERKEFETAKNMSADVIYKHLKDEAAEQVRPWWSLRRLYYLGLLLLGVIGHGLFAGIRPTWQMHGFQSFVLDVLRRLFGS